MTNQRTPPTTQGKTTTTDLAAEDFQVGYRYWTVRPGYESAWTIASVTIHTSENEVSRNGGPWYRPVIVTHTRRDGTVRELELGDMVAIQGPFKTEDPEEPAPATTAH
jgi:hypothetical protein